MKQKVPTIKVRKVLTKDDEFRCYKFKSKASRRLRKRAIRSVRRIEKHHFAKEEEIEGLSLQVKV